MPENEKDEGLINIEKMERAIRDLREPLGELALHFAGLEDQVTMTINALLRLSYEEGVILETVMRDFGSRVRLFQALIGLNVKDAELSKLGLRVASLINQANSDRNNLLHDAWNSYSPESGALHKIRFTFNEKGEIAQLPLYHLSRTVIQRSVKFIERAGLIVADWRMRFNERDLRRASPAPLPDKWYEGSPLHTHMKGQRKKQTPARPPPSRK
jgi:hypothetical protein